MNTPAIRSEKPLKPAEREHVVRLWMFGVAYWQMYRAVQDKSLRFAQAIIYSSQPLSGEQLEQAWQGMRSLPRQGRKGQQKEVGEEESQPATEEKAAEPTWKRTGWRPLNFRVPRPAAQVEAS